MCTVKYSDDLGLFHLNKNPTTASAMIIPHRNSLDGAISFKEGRWFPKRLEEGRLKEKAGFFLFESKPAPIKKPAKSPNK